MKDTPSSMRPDLTDLSVFVNWMRPHLVAPLNELDEDALLNTSLVNGGIDSLGVLLLVLTIEEEAGDGTQLPESSLRECRTVRDLYLAYLALGQNPVDLGSK